ncbi:hypothetical protein LTR37_007462 [Vermiconidia calcicola]|uniref:Uncharacterized protein n=1 Tax=Vermiconidia calcicola TaxID=1690605 RepID=A0ACC3NEQ3_9PEZI|nr:hypothetical protein LTR37_007462 [Vermiconidia calcicola]
MARFYPLYARRSDGKLEVIAKGKRKETNQPTDDQLDQRPDRNGIADYYREVGIDESKHLDWRRKLGGMLAREMEGKDKNTQSGSDSGYMLVTFPENYRLYEHVKKTEKDGKTEVKSKTHAAGGNDRQDAYLYGHPAGRKKRYRSPADFFPHLLWLCTDESGDPDNCGCKICSPEDLDEIVPGVKPKVKQETGPAASGMARQGSAQGMTKLKQEPGTPVQVSRPRSASQPLAPTPLPPPKSTDERIDRQYRTFMYRPGELVWFKRGQAWGLGAVLRRWVTTSNQYHYTVQPLSHPYAHPPPIVKSSDAELRPWLAWSVPRYTNDALNTLPEPPMYETADWQGLSQKRYGNGDLEVDGSILAAKSVDCSYTPIHPTKTVETKPNVTETHYDGIYLGAEKVWVGDPLRLQPGTDILVLHSVVERKKTSAVVQGHLLNRSTYLIGDTYQLQRINHNNPTLPTPASQANNPHLPQRLTDDLAFRNDRSIRAKGVASYWKLTAANSRVELDNVKGRWYEASLILPILQQAVFEDAVRKGEIGEATLWMNSRGDCITANRAPNLPGPRRENNLKASRREAFGAALPPHAEIKDGIEPPLPENVDPALEGLASQSSMDIDPRFETAPDTDINIDSDEIRVSRPGDANLVESSGIDEFMNLDGMDEQAQSQLPGFGQDYGQEASQQHYY